VNKEKESIAIPRCPTPVPAPATPIQREAWTCLWRRLLAEEEPARAALPQNTEAPETAIPEASKNCGPDCLDQAAPTASTSPRNTRQRHGRV
jgi:hypothetical protein